MSGEDDTRKSQQGNPFAVNDEDTSAKADSESEVQFGGKQEKREDVLNGDLERGPNPVQGEQPGAEAQDPNLVTWDGPDDPENPKQWTFRKKWAATGLVSLITFMTPMASSMIAPAEQDINRDLNIHSSIDSNLVFSIFLAAFVIGPLFIAPLSEVYGRVIVLQCANAFFLVFNLVCGFSQNLSQMLAFRFLAGLGGCAPQTVGGGVLGDLWNADERGKAVALYTLAPILGPSFGPLIGAWIAQRTTWRWSFYVITIFGALVQILFAFTASETYTPRILQRKAQRLRKETGNKLLHTKWETEDRSMVTLLRTSSLRVIILLGTQPIVQFLAAYMALLYGVVYLTLATFPAVWTDIYHESIGIGGLNYISLMIGMTFGAQTGGRLIDLIYHRLKAQTTEKKGRPEFRVPILFVSTFLVVGGLFMYGWSAQEHTHWIVPNIGIAIFGIGTTMTFTGLQTYTIDAYQVYAASAVGATAVARSITGFGFPLFASYMFENLGYGWGNSVLAFVALGIGYTGSFVLWFYGARLRSMSQYAAEG